MPHFRYTQPIGYIHNVRAGAWFASALRFLLFFCLAVCARAATISGTVKDSSGAVVPRARIEILGAGLAQPLVINADAAGRFTSADLAPGTYSLQVTSEGFEPLTQSVKLDREPVTLVLQISVASSRQEITVTGKVSAFANADPVYQELRKISTGVTFRLDGFTLQCDVATFEFKQGTLTFLSPVALNVTGAIFIGQGHFTLKPATGIDRNELSRRMKADQVEEDFSEVVFRFTNEQRMHFLRGSKGQVATPASAAAVFGRWQEKVRTRRELPVGFSEYLLNGDEMENVDAEVLAALYNPAHPPFFDAYIRGVRYKDLRFFFRARGGAVPQLGSPEEVALINHDPEGMEDGVWYLSHTLGEHAAHTASSHEERRYVAARKFNIETVIGGNDHLTSVARIQFAPLVGGERVVKFGLLPNLRVTRVTGADRKDLFFVQESRKADGSFYVILPEPMQTGEEYSVNVEYSGDRVITKAGNGSFYVRAREAWYPSLNDFNDKAVYDLTYKIPKRYKLISVGLLDKEWTEGNFAASHWTTAVPIAVAGFNFGDYHRVELADDVTHYHISGYFLPELPDSLAPFRNSALAGMSPMSMTKYALEQTRAQMELCTYYFGRTPVDQIYITEQPDFNFGQSWPNLVYLPISAYIDSTQRWFLLGRIENSLTAFVQEVTPHEVAHQWWGHAVGWASYHDQWLSEGFAEFSAGLFLQQAVGKDWQKDYVQFWDRLRRRILEKNQFGIAPNDAGPLWLGERLVSPRTADAYQNVTYPKGAFVLGMMRSLMFSVQDRDKVFIEMMHDFVETHKNVPASTESFKAVAEKHMTKSMDLERNGRLDWFFKEWVYGTEIPRYSFEYELSPGANGKTKLHMKLTQSEVNEKFAMLIPVFGDFGKGMIRLGQLPIVGNSTKTYDVELPAQPKKVALNAYKEILER